MLLHGRRVERADPPEAYAHRVLLNVFLGQRRPAWHREVPHGRPPELAALMGCSTGNVTAVTSRGWTRLREARTATRTLLTDGTTP